MSYSTGYKRHYVSGYDRQLRQAYSEYCESLDSWKHPNDVLPFNEWCAYQSRRDAEARQRAFERQNPQLRLAL